MGIKKKKQAAMDYTSEVKITQHSHDSEGGPGEAAGPGRAQQGASK